MVENSLQEITVKQPQVSIGMPVYNGESFIREALYSLVAQRFTDFELIISDNASTDRTEDICREYAEKDGRIRYIRQPHNIGARKNFSFVVDESVGQYFSWLAHDDALNNDFLSICVDYLNKNTLVALVSGDFLAVDENGHDLEVKELLEIRSTIPWQIRVSEFYRVPISNAFFCIYGLMRRDALVKVLSNVRRGPLLSASELPLLSRFAAIGEVASLPVILRKYRFHEKSAYHAEQKQLSMFLMRGRLMKCYNQAWHRADQVMVLMQSSYSCKFKFKVGYYVLRYNAINFLKRLCRFMTKSTKYLWKSKVPPKSF